MSAATAPRVAVSGKDYDPDEVNGNYKFFSLLDLGAAVFLGMSGVNFLLGATIGTFQATQIDRLVYGVYLVLFALVIATTSIAYLSAVRTWAKFVYTWTGRGASFIFLGFSALNTGSPLYFIVPLLVVAIGITYCVLAWCSIVPVPLPFMFSGALVSEYEREHPSYIDARRKHNARAAQAKLNSVARKKEGEKEALEAKEKALVKKEAQAKTTAAEAAAERKEVAKERRTAFS